MIDILKNLFKPNSDEKSEVSKSALAVKPLGRLPSWVSKGNARHSEMLSNVKKVNRYLEYQERRLLDLKKAKRYKSFVILWLILLKNSKSYQISLFHRVNAGWYWKFTSAQTIKLLKESMNKCRKWDMVLTLERFYIAKPNGKLRPIGAPTRQSRIISKALNDLIYTLFEDRLMAFQHGFKKDRGTWSALYDVWFKIAVLDHKYIYEFDFKSYFNNVRIEWVYTYLKIRSVELANLIIRIIGNIEYKFDRPIEELPDEAEIKVMGKSRWQRVKIEKRKSWKHIFFKDYLKPLIVRSGLPQGLSISPILATLMMEIIKPPAGLVMYADDGLFVRESKTEEIRIWFRQIKTFGVTQEPSKSGEVTTNFKFLGVEFNLPDEMVKYGESTFSWKNRDPKNLTTQIEISNWFLTVAQFYGKKSEGWTWDIRERSFATEFRNELSWPRRLITMIVGLWTAGPYNGYRYFLGGGCYHISALSTLSCGLLLEHSKDIRLAKIRELTFVESYDNKYHRRNKNKYWEENQWMLKFNLHKFLYLDRVKR